MTQPDYWFDTAELAQAMKTLDRLPAELEEDIKDDFENAASMTLSGAEAAAPVGETGDLSSSGYMQYVDEGGGKFHYDVSFGDGQETSTEYGYPQSLSSTVYPADDLVARGYTWFQELGFMSRGGNLVGPQPYLGPNFDTQVQELMSLLEGLYGA